MRKIAMIVLVVLPLQALAQNYQEAKLLGFKQVATGSSCDSSGTTTLNTYNKSANSSGSTSCSNTTAMDYFIVSNGFRYTLQRRSVFMEASPLIRLARGGIKSPLSKLAIGDSFQMRIDGKTAAIPFGNKGKETKYDILEASPLDSK